MRPFLAAALGISFLFSPVFAQSVRNPRGPGYRTVIVAPLAGDGTATDPRVPAFLRGGGGEKSREFDWRWVPSDDGRWALVELRSPRPSTLQTALTAAPGLAARFDLNTSRKADVETELKRYRKDFRWEDFAGVPVELPSFPAPKAASAAEVPRGASSERSAYSYYYSDAFSTIDLTHWHKNGDLTGGANGLQPSTSAGGALISKDPPQFSTSSYEISTPLRITGPGVVFDHFVRATNDARVGAGTYWMVEYSVTEFTPGVSCSAALKFFRRVDGILSQHQSTGYVGCHDGMELRTVATIGMGLHVFAGDTWIGGAFDVAYSTGAPGVGVRGASAGAILSARLGGIDTTGPWITDVKEIRATAFPDAVDLQWRGSIDGLRGFWKYDIWRQASGQSTPEYRTGVLEPVFTDTTVAPSTQYTYTIVAWDLHYAGSQVSFTVLTPPAGATRDARDPGLRPTGSYWGAGGEQINLQSGNLHFSLPLVTAVGRGKTSLSLGLSYDSQQWRSDGVAEWSFLKDIGYGLGWRLQLGSLTPSYGGWTTVHHYTFTDSSGAEYRLTNQPGTQLWTSKDGLYLTYDAATAKLWFPDGSFWQMDCESGGAELDAGARYPTLVQDSNGNQVTLTYDQGIWAGTANSSGRIVTVTDARAPLGSPTFGFSYLPSQVQPNVKRKLVTIQNYIGAGPMIGLSYSSTEVTYRSPFTGNNFATGYQLQSVSSAHGAWGFTYSSNGSNELEKVTTPMSGEIGWTYVTTEYWGGKWLREVATRWTKTTSAATADNWQFSFDPGDSSRLAHLWRQLTDATGTSSKVWFFETNAVSPYLGLSTVYEERTFPSHTPVYRVSSSWTTQATSGQPYIASTVTTLDPGQTYEKQQTTTQTLDAYGNLTQQVVNDYAGSGQPARTYTMTYVTTASYLNAYLRRLLKTATLSDGTITRQLVTNHYDYQTGACTVGYAPAPSDVRQWTDLQTYIRGNVTAMDTPSQPSVCLRLNKLGLVELAYVGSAFRYFDYTASTNYTLPTVVTPNSNPALAETRTYNSFLGLTHIDAPNSVSMDFTWNAQALPSSSQSPHGATTTTVYSGSGNSVITQTTNGKVSETTKDGFGRVVRVRTGVTANYVTTFHAAVSTEYAPCACSPLGKLKRVSMPYDPAASPNLWTTYEYDARGRTVKVTPPGNAGYTSYVYQGNTVKVLEPNTDRWKLFTMDAFGNLIQVEEPNPGTGSDFVTTYNYTLLNQLKTATMTRGSVTQTRTWSYDTDSRLSSVALPETGTTNFTYDVQSRIATRTDAKGQRQEFTYDSYNRVTEIRTGPEGSTSLYRRLVYDGGSENGMGRLTRVDYGPFDYYSNTIPKLRESFGYTPGGLLAGRTVSMNTWNASFAGVTAQFLYNDEGRLTRVNYPRGWTNGEGGWRQDPAISYEYAFDAKGQISTMTEKNSVYGDTAVASGVSYNLAGQMTAATVFGTARTWQYNDRGQLTREAAGGLMDFTYTFDAAHNDGRVKTRADAISGETVTYLYDKLGRLSSATATGAGVAWSQTFAHDGFGNLTQLTGSGTNLSLTVNDKNQITSGGASYDLNGNLSSINGHGLGYTVENRLSMVSNVYIDAMPETAGYGTEAYGYSVMGQRIYVERSMYTGWMQRELRMYGPDGSIIGEYIMKPATSHPYEEVFYPLEKMEKRRVYFAGRLVKFGTKAAVTDRLGSLIAHGSTRYRYYPYGEAIGPQEWDKPQFATYTRDGSSGLDDAMNRQYDRIWGRFTAPDPYQASGGPTDPGSWNRYAYVGGDPANYLDHTGLQRYSVYWWGRRCSGPSDDRSCQFVSGMFVYDDGESPGGGGGTTTSGPGTGRPLGLHLRLNERLRGQTAEAWRKLSAKCKEALSQRGIDATGAAASAGEIVFYDATFEGDLLVKDLTGYVDMSPSKTISAWLGDRRAVVLPMPDATPSNKVVVGSTFNSEVSFGTLEFSQAITLIHESLHVFSKQNDLQLANTLGLGNFPDTVVGARAASTSISAWLAYGCAPVN